METLSYTEFKSQLLTLGFFRDGTDFFKSYDTVKILCSFTEREITVEIVMMPLPIRQGDNPILARFSKDRFENTESFDNFILALILESISYIDKHTNFSRTRELNKIILDLNSKVYEPG